MQDFTFKTLWTNGNIYCRNYLNRIIKRIIDKDISEYSLYSNELSLNNYKSLANRVDILLVSKNSKHKVNIELNKTYTKALVNKNDSYIYKLAGEFYTTKKEEKKYSKDINVEQVNLNGFHNRLNYGFDLHYTLIDKRFKTQKNGIKIHDIYLLNIEEIINDIEFYRDLKMFNAKSYKEMELLICNNKEREEILMTLKRLGSEEEFVDLYDHEEFLRIMQKELAENARKRGLRAGRKEGRKEGILQNKYDMTKIMLENGEDIDKICLYSGLTKENVLSIKEENATYTSR